MYYAITVTERSKSKESLFNGSAHEMTAAKTYPSLSEGELAPDI